MVIRMRHTRAHTKNRRSHHGLKDQNLSKCSHCGEAHRPHHMCLECGYYNGRLIMDMKAEKEKREARIHAKEEIRRNELGATEDSSDVEVSEDAVEEKEEQKEDKKTEVKEVEAEKKETEKDDDSKKEEASK